MTLEVYISVAKKEATTTKPTKMLFRFSFLEQSEIVHADLEPNV